MEEKALFLTANTVSFFSMMRGSASAIIKMYAANNASHKINKIIIIPRDVTVFAIYVMRLLDTNYSCLTFIYSVVGDDEAIEVQVEDCEDEPKDTVLCNCLCQKKLHLFPCTF